jgi:hypothetical protein
MAADDSLRSALALPTYHDSKLLLVSLVRMHTENHTDATNKLKHWHSFAEAVEI